MKLSAFRFPVGHDLTLVTHLGYMQART